MPTWPEFWPWPVSYPVTGTGTFICRLAGTRAARLGRGRLLRDGSFMANRWSASVRTLDFNGEEAESKNIALKHYESSVSG